MLIKAFKFVFGKVIGLDEIPKEDRDKFVKEVAIPALKDAVKEAVIEGVKNAAEKRKKK